jgi:hypothetical protein
MLSVSMQEIRGTLYGIGRAFSSVYLDSSRRSILPLNLMIGEATTCTTPEKAIELLEKNGLSHDEALKFCIENLIVWDKFNPLDKKFEWTDEDQKESFKHGWGLFFTESYDYHRDNGHLYIQALGEPENVCEECGIASLNVFDPPVDRDAIAYVERRAQEGCKTSRKAICMVIDDKSPQYFLESLRATWHII